MQGQAGNRSSERAPVGCVVGAAQRARVLRRLQHHTERDQAQRRVALARRERLRGPRGARVRAWHSAFGGLVLPRVVEREAEGRSRETVIPGPAVSVKLDGARVRAPDLPSTSAGQTRARRVAMSLVKKCLLAVGVVVLCSGVVLAALVLWPEPTRAERSTTTPTQAASQPTEGEQLTARLEAIIAEHKKTSFDPDLLCSPHTFGESRAVEIRRSVFLLNNLDEAFTEDRNEIGRQTLEAVQRLNAIGLRQSASRSWNSRSTASWSGRAPRAVTRRVLLLTLSCVRAARSTIRCRRRCSFNSGARRMNCAH